MLRENHLEQDTVTLKVCAVAFYRYLKRQSKDKLPDPRSLLSRKLPSASIASANKEARRVILDPEPVKGVKARILSCDWEASSRAWRYCYHTLL